MSPVNAVALLIERFPVLKSRVDDLDELFEMPHVSYGLLATELLENSEDEIFLTHAAKFIDELANSGDDVLEEFLVIDVLEGIAQSPDLTKKLVPKLGSKASVFLERVEREYFGRNPTSD